MASCSRRLIMSVCSLVAMPPEPHSCNSRMRLVPCQQVCIHATYTISDKFSDAYALTELFHVLNKKQPEAHHSTQTEHTIVNTKFIQKASLLEWDKNAPTSSVHVRL